MTPQDLKFTKEHEWVRIEGAEAVFGISDFAQSALGDITYIELPTVGRALKLSEIFSTVESVKAASDIYAPISGEIIAVNADLENEPEKINKSPYGDGWICRVRVADASELNSLMDFETYEKFAKESKS